MEQRQLWLDCLIALVKGRFLHKGGESAAAIILIGVPQAVLVFEDLVGQGWIADVDGKGRRYAITLAGRAALRDGIQWYRGLPGWRRLLRPRLGLGAVERFASSTGLPAASRPGH